MSFEQRVRANDAAADAIAYIGRVLTFALVLALCVLCLVALAYLWFGAWSGYYCIDIDPGHYRIVCYPK